MPVVRKRISDRMKIDCLLDRVHQQFGEYLKCAISGEPMKPGNNVQFDHIHALVHGGDHTYRHLRPVLYDPHKRKTAQDIRDNAKIERLLKKKNKPGISRLAAGRAFRPRRGSDGKFARAG